MGSSWTPSRLFRLALEILLALSGVIIVSQYVPWSLVLSNTIPSGGDNPAHPVLMKTIGEAFFEHLKLVHYSYDFWGGFEAYQFYFPLSYLSGAFLSRFIDSNVAFKLITIFGIVTLPAAFYAMAATLRMSVPARVLAGLLSIPFLYTEAHVMWGGNVFSALAGMIGNAWGFVFFVLAFGFILRSGVTGRFSFPAVVLSVLASLSHFYMLLMLFMLFAALLAEDVVEAAWKSGFKGTLRTLTGVARARWPVYAAGAASFLLMAWWILPLVHYKPFSSDLGGDWDVKFFGTFTVAEKVFFAFSILAGAALLALKRSTHTKVLITSFVFLGFYLLLYSFNDIFHTTAFIKIRLWPSIYFGLYFVGIAVADELYLILPRPVFAVLIPALWFLVPPDTAFNNSRSWMEWNFSGLEAKPAWADLHEVLEALKKEPQGRVSYESADEANGILGSVRTPELIPYLTQHEIILGGIVNSATYAGVGYMLHCLSSDGCAGWPPGSIMPEKDIDRSVEMMRSLGMRYHLAITKANRELYGKSPELEPLFQGKDLALFKVKGEVPMVEVYDGKLPVWCASRAVNALLNFPRWDALRRAGVIFDDRCSMSEQDSMRWANFLVSEWNTGHRVFDRGWKERKDRITGKLNLYLFAFHRGFDPAFALNQGFEPFVADRGFDPQVLATNTQEGYSEVGVPLYRTSPGPAPINIQGRGYRIFESGRELPMGKISEIELKPTRVGGLEGAFTWLVFKPDLKDPYRYIEMSTTDASVATRFPGPERVELPARITDRCNAKLERNFHELTLTTDCVGKPHLIKYSYYPKWSADVPIQLGSDGFMALTPKERVTVLKHRYGLADWLGLFVSWATLLALGFAAAWRFRPKSSALQANP